MNLERTLVELIEPQFGHALRLVLVGADEDAGAALARLGGGHPGDAVVVIDTRPPPVRAEAPASAASEPVASGLAAPVPEGHFRVAKARRKREEPVAPTERSLDVYEFGRRAAEADEKRRPRFVQDDFGFD